MRVDIITIFPEYFGPLDVSLLGKARARGVVDVRVHDLRRWTTGPHRTVDDAPYGGGPGMVMRPEPWWGALTEITSAVHGSAGSPRAAAGVPPGAVPPGAAALPGTVPGGVQRPRVLVPTPSGRAFTQVMAGELA
ncbi:MAG TPA: hypothetical protein VKP11_01605, partial [Frankiaceae bacterium]|nr:hypothetical protein [Frankiaceae bacterium]